MLGGAIGLPEATIEDLVPRADYAAAVAAALEREVDLDSDELAAPTNVAALTKYWERLGWGKFGSPEEVATTLWLVEQ
jgi:NAD-dependent oxidoreductase involved in siderophore biosynthesis